MKPLTGLIILTVMLAIVLCNVPSYPVQGASIQEPPVTLQQYLENSSSDISSQSVSLSYTGQYLVLQDRAEAVVFGKSERAYRLLRHLPLQFMGWPNTDEEFVFLRSADEVFRHNLETGTLENVTKLENCTCDHYLRADDKSSWKLLTLKKVDGVIAGIDVHASLPTLNTIRAVSLPVHPKMTGILFDNHLNKTVEILAAPIGDNIFYDTTIYFDDAEKTFENFIPPSVKIVDTGSKTYLYLITDLFTPHASLVRVRNNEGSLEHEVLFEDPQYDVSNAIITAEDRVVGVVVDAEVYRYRQIDHTHTALHELQEEYQKDLDFFDFTIVQTSGDGQQIIAKIETDVSLEYHLVDVTRGVRTPLKTVAKSSPHTTLPIWIEGPLGSRLAYLRYGEQSDSQRSLMVVLHGGPKERDRFVVDELSGLYVAMGYQVLNLNYSGSSGFEDKTEALPLSEKLGAIDQEISAAVETITNSWLGNKVDSVELAGGSFGGLLALRTAQNPASRGAFDHIVALNPVVDISAQLSHFEASQKQTWRKLYANNQFKYYGTAPKQLTSLDQLKAVSPNNEQACPVVDLTVLVGLNDQTVPPSNAISYFEHLDCPNILLQKLSLGRHTLMSLTQSPEFYFELLQGPRAE